MSEDSTAGSSEDAREKRQKRERSNSSRAKRSKKRKHRHRHHRHRHRNHTHTSQTQTQQQSTQPGKRISTRAGIDKTHRQTISKTESNHLIIAGKTFGVGDKVFVRYSRSMKGYHGIIDEITSRQVFVIEKLKRERSNKNHRIQFFELERGSINIFKANTTT